MSLWGKVDQANNAPKYSIIAGSPNTGVQLYGTKVVGLDAGEVASGNATHPGWVSVTRGTGPVKTITINVGGSGYANTDYVRVSGGAVNAIATITTNTTGGIITLNLTNPGGGFTNVATTTTFVANSTNSASTGTGGTFTVTLGGRAGRIQTETLVAMGSMTANGSGIAGY